MQPTSLVPSSLAARLEGARVRDDFALDQLVELANPHLRCVHDLRTQMPTESLLHKASELHRVSSVRPANSKQKTHYLHVQAIAS